MPAAVDEAAGAADPLHAFLRAGWFSAAAGEREPTTVVARRASGQVVAAIPFVAQQVGPLAVRQVPGSYWPYRSFPIAADASDAEIAALLAAPEVRCALGRAWRLGPVYDADPTARRLTAAAQRGGWTVLSRRVATGYVIDLKRLTAEGAWPSTKRLQRNRWLERRLARDGELSFTRISDGWDAGALDALAAVERESWVVREGGDAKFLAEAPCRRIWEGVIADPELAAMLTGWTMHIGGEPAAFVFALDAGKTRHIIANGYSERFAENSPGLVLLWRVFGESAAAGFETIDWGAGDAGYKGRMGAEPGPDLVDLLFVRGKLLAAAAAPLWRRGG